jgi:nucleotide-binding universal stress UspA family protein
MGYRKLLCCIDFSETSRAALRSALELATSGASVTLAHVFQLPLATDPSGFFEASVVGEAIAAAEQTLEEWAREARTQAPNGVEIATVFLQGAPWDRLVETARVGRHDLIVIGTHGRTGLKHALIGSVAEKVVRHAPCPVLVVRPQA